VSLVLDALRRVEKNDARAGSVGVAVASYRPARRPGRSWTPLLLGIIVGGVVLFLLGPNPIAPGPRDPLRAQAGAAGSFVPTLRARGGAALPPPLILESVDAGSAPRSPVPTQPTTVRRGQSPNDARAASPSAVSSPLVLQAISERDSHPIAVISDQLVKEGDLIGKTRVLKIGLNTVEVLLDSGRVEVIRFPPPPDPTPTPDGR